MQNCFPGKLYLAVNFILQVINVIQNLNKNEVEFSIN